uniref:ARTD15_N domain-containing protein n=1 Tax=Glossina brevipalpis TaxID=37001 RepID=A0A1A9WR64_9MUSC
MSTSNMTITKDDDSLTTLKTQSCVVKHHKQPSSHDDNTLLHSSEYDAQSAYSYDEFEGNPQRLQMATNFLKKIEALRSILETDILAADAKWTLFVAAALSYRYDSQLKPFPSRYAEEQSVCDIDSLVSVINDTPKLRVVYQHIVEKNYDEFDADVMELLHWVLVEMKEFNLRSLETEEISSLIRTIDSKADLTKPVYGFEVISPDEEFHQHTGDKPITLAFYGNKLDTFYSVINNGFRVQATPTTVFKLTNDFNTSMQLSPTCPGWGASQCGPMVSCTALCDFAYSSELVHFQSNENNKKSVNIDVMSPDLLRIRYIFLLGSVGSKHRRSRRGFFSWVRRHKYSISLATYVLVMLSIGIANGGGGHAVKDFLAKKLSSVLDFCKHATMIES